MKRETKLAILACVVSTAAVITYAQEMSLIETGGGVVPGFLCLNCELTGQILRDKTVQDQACIDAWGDSAPRRWYVGRCKRFQCATGYYYLWDGWTAMPIYNCTSTFKDDPAECPNSSCTYIPWLSDPHPVGAFKKGTGCDTLIKDKNISSIEVAKIVQKAMNSDETQ